MRKQEKNEPGARHPDISGLAAQLQRSSLDVRGRTKTARLCTERRHGWLRRRLGLDQRYRERDVVVRLSRYDGDGTYDNPAAIITEPAMQAKRRIGDTLVLTDDRETTRAGTPPPAAEIASIRGGWDGQMVLLCRWWRRARNADDTVDNVARMKRDDLLPHVHAR